MKVQIYLTIFKPTGQLYVGQHAGDIYRDGYVGSGTKVRELLAEHGRDAFVVGVLAECSRAMAGPIEEWYIRKLNAAESPMFMNVSKNACQPDSRYKCSCSTQCWSRPLRDFGGSKEARRKAVNVYHKKYAPKGMSADCAWHRFKSWFNFGAVLASRSHRGWSMCKDVALNPRAINRKGTKSTIYHYTKCPGGITGTSKDLRGRIGFPPPKELIDGKRSCRGWSTCLMKSRQAVWDEIPLYWYSLDNMDGILASAIELCERFDIEKNILADVFYGRYKSRKGWALDRRYVKACGPKHGVEITIVKDGVEKTGRQSELQRELKLSKGKLSELASGKRKSHKGWRLVDAET